MVQVAGDTFAIPLDAVSETTKIETEKLSDVNNRKAVTLRGEVLGIVELSELLDMPQTMDERDVLPMVVIQDNDRRLGLVVGPPPGAAGDRHQAAGPVPEQLQPEGAFGRDHHGRRAPWS